MVFVIGTHPTLTRKIYKSHRVCMAAMRDFYFRPQVRSKGKHNQAEQVRPSLCIHSFPPHQSLFSFLHLTPPHTTSHPPLSNSVPPSPHHLSLTSSHSPFQALAYYYIIFTMISTVRSKPIARLARPLAALSSRTLLSVPSQVARRQLTINAAAATAVASQRLRYIIR